MLIIRNLQQIAELVGGEIKGNCTRELTGVASLKEAMDTDVAFLGNEKYVPQVLPSKAESCGGQGNSTRSRQKGAPGLSARIRPRHSPR